MIRFSNDPPEPVSDRGTNHLTHTLTVDAPNLEHLPGTHVAGQSPVE